MNKTVSITFENEVYSVRLASENPSDNYGILDVTSGAAAVAYGTAVTKNSAISYSYTFTVENAHLYLVSWEIVANSGEDPYYQVEEVGPYYSLDDTSVRACASTQGTFAPGYLCTLLLKVTNFDGIAVDAYDLSVHIYDFDGLEVSLSSNIPDRGDIGYYAFDWTIPTDQALGKYVVVWNYTIDGIPKSEVQSITISSKDNSTVLYSGRHYAARKMLEYYIGCMQSIPVYFEQAKPSRDNKTFRFTFDKWNQSPGVKIYRNQEIINDSVEVDFFSGKVVFDDELTQYDNINADYNFKWFSDEQLDLFIENAVNELNSYPPNSNYTIDNIPDRYIPAVLYGASRDAIRNLLMCIQFQQNAQIFGGTEGAQKAYSNFESLKQNYEKSWDTILTNKKYGPYPMTRIISVSEYALPGGRCIGPYSTVTYKIGNLISETNVKYLFDIYKQCKCVKILSQNDKTGNMVFSPINYIWESGLKDTYELKTKHGYNIRTSSEHLFFVNGKYIPLMNIKQGDILVTSNNNKTELDEVKLIKKLRRKEMMCDLEIFSTANLFINGVKCHNSRWFRYLYKS